MHRLLKKNEKAEARELSMAEPHFKLIQPLCKKTKKKEIEVESVGQYVRDLKIKCTIVVRKPEGTILNDSTTGS